MRPVILAMAILPTALAAQGLRDGDVSFTAEELLSELSGNTVEFYDGSKARYGDDGRYAYTYTDDGPAWVGSYETTDDSAVCVTFDNGFGRCDTFVFASGRLVLIIEDGTRFPVRRTAPN